MYQNMLLKRAALAAATDAELYAALIKQASLLSPMKALEEMISGKVSHQIAPNQKAIMDRARAAFMKGRHNPFLGIGKKHSFIPMTAEEASFVW